MGAWEQQWVDAGAPGCPASAWRAGKGTYYYNEGTSASQWEKVTWVVAAQGLQHLRAARSCGCSAAVSSAMQHVRCISAWAILAGITSTDEPVGPMRLIAGLPAAPVPCSSFLPLQLPALQPAMLAWRQVSVEEGDPPLEDAHEEL